MFFKNYISVNFPSLSCCYRDKVPRQKTLFERLTGIPTLTAEEWKKREEEVIERMLKFVMTEPQEPSSESHFDPLMWTSITY